MQIIVHRVNSPALCLSMPSSATPADLLELLSCELESDLTLACLSSGCRPLTQLSNNMIVEVSPKLLGGGTANKNQMDPAFQALADRLNIQKKVCRRCYATNPFKATTCRKRKCGRCADLRLKKVSKK